MPISCDIGSLVDASKCFVSCLSPEQRSAIQTYLLAVRAGGSLDPHLLSSLSERFLCCLTEPQMKAIQVYLACQLVNGGSGSCENLSGAASPENSVTPDFIGQVYTQTDVTPEAIWISVGLTSADWELRAQYFFPAGGKTLLVSAGTTAWNVGDAVLSSGLFIQNADSLLTLTAPNLTLLENRGSAFPGAGSQALSISSNDVLSAISLPALTAIPSTSGGMLITANPLLASISMPLLTTAGGASVTGITITTNVSLTSISLPSLATSPGHITITGNAALTTLSFPVLTSILGSVSAATFTGNTLLASLSLPALVTVAGGINASSLANLTSVTLTSYLPTNAKAQNFGSCALTEASVDHILARCVANAAYVSGTVTLSGGTNATPSAAGLVDKATLIGRGCTVNTN